MININQLATSKNLITVILFLFIGYKIYQLFIQPKIVGVINISSQEFQAMMNSNTMPVLIDVRTPAEFELQHLPGSLNYPLSTLKLNTLKISREYGTRPIVVLCRSGMRSRSGAVILKQAGIEKVYNLLGGIP